MNYNFISNKVEIHGQKCFSARLLPLVENMFLVMWVKLYISSELNRMQGWINECSYVTTICMQLLTPDK